MSKIIELNDLSGYDLSPHTERSEKQLLRFYEPNPGVFVAESPNVIQRALNAGYMPISFLVEKSQLRPEVISFTKDYPDVPVYIAEKSLLQQITGYSMTRGVLSLLHRRPLPDAARLIAVSHRVAVLEDIVNPTNLGAIFRSAAALGVEAVLLTPPCSDPLYRRAARVSMGTVFQVPWTYLSSHWIGQLKEAGFKTVAMALREDSLPMDSPELSEQDRLAIVLGTEGDGLKNETISSCDYTVKIPMTHGVDSLNVAAASAVAFWQLCRVTNPS